MMKTEQQGNQHMMNEGYNQAEIEREHFMKMKEMEWREAEEMQKQQMMMMEQ